MISEQTDLLVGPRVHERYDPLTFTSEKHTVIRQNLISLYQSFQDVFWKVFTGDANTKIGTGLCFFEC